MPLDKLYHFPCDNVGVDWVMAERIDREATEISVIYSTTEDDDSEHSGVEVKVKSKPKKKVNSERRYACFARSACRPMHNIITLHAHGYVL